MKPMFFGDSSRPLFGIFHPARSSGAVRRPAVLLCYPGVHEYDMSHWTFRRLAGMLARSGRDVLRFDYFGTGDSAGETVEASPDRWVADIQTAARELCDMTSARALSVVGLRLGAALAARACSDGLTVRDLVLWDPVVRGDEHLAELASWDRYRNLLLLHARRARRSTDDLLGFRMSPEVRRQIASIDMCRLPRFVAERVLLVTSDESTAHVALRDHLAETGARVEMQHVRETRSMAQSVIGEEAFAGTEGIGTIVRALMSDGTAPAAAEASAEVRGERP